MFPISDLESDVDDNAHALADALASIKSIPLFHDLTESDRLPNHFLIDSFNKVSI